LVKLRHINMSFWRHSVLQCASEIYDKRLCQLSWEIHGRNHTNRWHLTLHV